MTDKPETESLADELKGLKAAPYHNWAHNLRNAHAMKRAAAKKEREEAEK